MNKQVLKNGIIVPGFLIAILIGSLVGYGKLQGDVSHNTESIKKVENVPVEIAGIKKDIEYLQTDFNKFDKEQSAMRRDIKEVLKALKE